MELLAVVVSGFVLAAVAPLIHRALPRAVGWVLALLPLALFSYLGSLAPRVAAGDTVRERTPWVPAFDVDLSFHVDGLGLLFAMLITGIGTLIMVYAGGYLKGHPQLGRFYVFLLMFMGSMLGVVLSDNIVTLFVFWELTSLTSYLLIGFNHTQLKSRKAALQALLVTGSGGLALLAGLLLMGNVVGSFEMSTILAAGGEVKAHALYLPILLLVLAGAFTKSAQFPFHFWLPNAMEAPTPVSAYLHSATMVKAGIYLLARFSPALAGTPEWIVLVTVVGATTMFVGAYLALRQTDMKRVLAYSTVSALGTLTLLLGIGSLLAVTAAMVFLLAHAMYKGSLFQVAGALDHETGTRHLEKLGGLRHHMPFTATAGILAALSFAGLAPLFSFIGKELLLEALLAATGWLRIVLAVVLVSTMVLVAVALIVGVRPFFGALKPTPRAPHEAPPSLWMGPLLLAFLGLILGVLPNLVSASVITPAVQSITGAPPTFYLALWHGVNPALLLSLVTLAGGLLLFWQWTHVQRVTARLDPYLHKGPEHGYERTLSGMLQFAAWQSRILQNGKLRYYLLVIMATLVAVTAYTAFARHGIVQNAAWSPTRPHELGVGVLMLAAAFLITQIKSRLGAVALLGVVGYGQALLYVFFGAPDLAMTQFLFETLTVLLFVLVFYHMPRFASVSKTSTRLRDLALSLTFGTVMAMLVLSATGVQLHPPISEYFAEESYVAAHGRNVVNVILVDFRALDTLGEITVLAVAAVGVYALLKLKTGRRRTE